jgi:uncharacterized protein YkvS
MGNVWYTSDSLPDIRKAMRYVSSRLQSYSTFTNQMVAGVSRIDEDNNTDTVNDLVDLTLMDTQRATEKSTVVYLKHYKLIITVWAFIKAFLAIPLGIIFTTKEIGSEAAVHVLFASATLKAIADIVNHRVRTELKRKVRYVGHGDTIFTTN